MNESKVDNAIEEFMHPKVYTGVKPILLVAEELVTAKQIGDIVEAVWVGLDSSEEFRYISKFAVNGKIFLKKYHNEDEREAFYGRLALPNKNNLKNTVIHREVREKIKVLKSKRSDLLDEVNRSFYGISDNSIENQEVYVFEKKDGDWEKEFFSNFDINNPYKVVKILGNPSKFELHLQNPRTGEIQEHSLLDKFYGYFIGSKADIDGLKMKSESYLKNIESLQNDAKKCMKEIEWLDLDDTLIQEIVSKLPQHPFEEYFNYVKKENVRKVDVSDELVHKLEDIILKHMPENNTPLGMKYIPIDKLLYLFHEIIPRNEALLALESCDIVYEPPGLVLGFEGKHQLPPKFLVSISHVASAYQQFSSFIDACKNVEYNKRDNQVTGKF